MKQVQQRTLYSLVSAQTFLDKHVDVLGPISNSQARRELDAAVAEASRHHTNQGSATLTLAGQMSRQTALANELVRMHLQPIAKFARAKLHGVPEYAELTAIGNPAKPKQLVGIARSMAVAAGKYSDKFTNAGLASNTVARLTAATDALEDAIKQRIAARGTRKNSTNNIDAVLARGRDAVKVIESAITQLLKSDDPLLATWKSESRVEEKPGKPRQKKDAALATSAAPVAAHPTTVTATANPAPAALPASTTQKAA